MANLFGASLLDALMPSRGGRADMTLHDWGPTMRMVGVLVSAR